MSDSLQALFRPNRLAVIGASAKPGKLGFTIFKNILDAGFGGQVIPVNPKGETILGVPSVKSVDDIPSGTDLAVVIIPAASVPGAILQLGERKVRAGQLVSPGTQVLSLVQLISLLLLLSLPQATVTSSFTVGRSSPPMMKRSPGDGTRAAQSFSPATASST